MRAKEFITEVTRITYGRDEWGNIGAWGKEHGRPEPVRMLPVNRIVVYEPDTKFDQPHFRKHLEKVKAALRRGEEIEPITVHRMPGEFLQYQVLDGHHRFKAYRDLGLKKIPVRIAHRFNVTHQDVAENFADGKKSVGIHESLDNPYPITWARGDFDDYDATAKLDDGTPLNIMFNFNDLLNTWIVLFDRDNTYEITNTGDASRIFATVVAATREFIAQEHPDRLSFHAEKNELSRIKLYNKLVQRYAEPWGYDAEIWNRDNVIIYNLDKKQDLGENFADGKKPGRKGLANRSGVNCKQSVTKLRQVAKNSTGEKRRMAHWCANMKSGKKSK